MIGLVTYFAVVGFLILAILSLLGFENKLLIFYG
jgi:hypothetical protein